MEKFDGQVLPALFCLSEVNTGNFMAVSRFTNSKRPGKKLRCKESTSIRDLKVT